MTFQNTAGMTISKALIGFALCGALVACSGGSDEKRNKNRLEGERIPVLTFEQNLAESEELANLQVQLPRPYRNKSWAQAGGNQHHVMQHLSLGDNPQKVWSADIGEESNGRRSTVSMPIIENGVVYAMDSMAKVTAYTAQTGKKVWQKKFKEPGETENIAYGGGITAGPDALYVTNGYGHVAALDKSTGAEIWVAKLAVPMRGAPTYADGRLFALTHDNQTYALNATDGSILWNEVGISENAGLAGAASPAVIGNTVISAYSSGELYAMRVENGRVLWSDTLNTQTRLNAMSTLRDIDGHPVIYDGKVYAISHSGRMVSIDLRTGVRVWEQNIGSQHTPWVAGEYIYVVTPEGQVVCITRRTGLIRWIQQLERFKDPDRRKEAVLWHGPTLAGDRLIVTSSHGYAMSLSPYDGSFISGMDMGDDMEMAPIVVDDMLYFLTRDAKLVAMR
ncbi:PQQ-binding-like beta-propeller repeat protein [Paremcibacter congregatus]|uniref:outer membrane protein assembly factor BamB family protein n=1 Tax=Paremcibacter congregatus TaxID=2043170 RepID=UPI003A8DB991